MCSKFVNYSKSNTHHNFLEDAIWSLTKKKIKKYIYIYILFGCVCVIMNKILISHELWKL